MTSADLDGAGNVTLTSALGGILVINLLTGEYEYTPPGSVDNSGGNPTDVFSYTIEDGDGSTSSTTLTIEIKPAVAPPEVALGVDGGGALKEDTEGALSFSATPDGDDQITQIVISGFPTGGDDWTLGTLTLSDDDGAVTPDSAVYDAVAGTYTIGLSGTNGPVTGTLAVTPNEDSDVDQTLSIVATATDSGLSADSAAANADVVVDAVADGGVNVTTGGIASSDNGAPVGLNLTLAVAAGNAANPAGDLQNDGGFDTDGSESVTTITVTLSGAGIGSDTDAGVLFDDTGLTITAIHVPGSLEWTFEGSEADCKL